MINLLTGGIVAAYKQVSNLATYSEGEVKDEISVRRVPISRRSSLPT